jgi:PPOX class probable F420-dependent enzyme
MKQVPETHQDLLVDENRAFAFLATLMPDGSPQVTPVWFNADDEFLYVNTSKGRVKDQNMRARPQVSVVLMQLDNPYRYVQIRGEVVEITEEGAEEHINFLSFKYDSQPFNIQAGQVRVKCKIKPY